MPCVAAAVVAVSARCHGDGCHGDQDARTTPLTTLRIVDTACAAASRRQLLSF